MSYNLSGQKRGSAMIRFQDMAEKKDASEPLSSAEYQGIKPHEHLSKTDAMEFWDDVFVDPPEIQDMYFVEEENLLSLIFDRHEDEFTFDFKLDDEIQSVLSCFDSAKWETLSDGERRAAIDALADVIGKKLGLDKNPIIQFYDGQDGSYGAYLPEQSTIVINSNTLPNAKEAVDTIAHEMRHAYQHQRATHQETLLDKL